MQKAMAPHSSTLAWKIPWGEEPGRLQSMGSLRVRHDGATSVFHFPQHTKSTCKILNFYFSLSLSLFFYFDRLSFREFYWCIKT